MTTVTMQEAQANLLALISGLQPGEEILITDQGRPLAAVKKAESERRLVKRREPGLCKGMITLLVEDDEHLQGFAEYMP